MADRARRRKQSNRSAGSVRKGAERTVDQEGEGDQSGSWGGFGAKRLAPTSLVGFAPQV